ncbi:MAG: hypothetical protein ONB43_10555 [candidate division KSB1 bacterium]|nr:hypothetical protein [candidate division KSB1 bacterium]
MIREPHITGNAQMGKSESGAARRGFAPMEKWMIWAVFCLLVGLSSHLIVFPALLLMSWGVARFRWYVREKMRWAQRWPALVVFLAGLAMMIWPIFH